MQKTYTIDIQPMEKSGLQVTIPELGITVPVASTRRDDAIDAAHRAIAEYQRKQRQASQAKAS